MSDYFAVLVWNVRGLNAPAHRDVIYQIVALSGASVVIFSEIKMEVIDYPVVARCCGNEFDRFFFLPAIGTCGGVLIAWKSSVVSLSNPHLSANTITVRVGDNNAQG